MIGLLNRAAFNLRLLTLFLPLWSFVVTGALWWHWAVLSNVDPHPYFALLVFTTIAWSVASENYGLCTTAYILTSGGKVYAAFLATLMTVFADLVFMFFYRGIDFSQSFVTANVLVLLFSTLNLRMLLRTALNGKFLSKSGGIRVLLIGADEFAERVAQCLAAREFKGVEIVGFVQLPGQEAGVSGPVYSMDEVGQVVARDQLDDVVLALPAPRLRELPQIRETLRHIGVPVRVVLDLGDQTPSSDHLFNVNGVWMVDVCHTPAESVMYMILKRGFDLAFSAVALLLLAPVMALIAVIIKSTSPGPVLFAQERVGFKGNVFRMYKFRTMHLSSEAESNTKWTCRDDSRRTRFGVFLRRTSLDEIPQFLNVLKGDMSVVGPRPERPYFVQKFAVEVPHYGARHYLKVGITGWAQVNGWRGDTSIEKRIEHDLYYLQNWSLLFDLRIVLRTVLHTFTARHAY